MTYRVIIDDKKVREIDTTEEMLDEYKNLSKHKLNFEIYENNKLVVKVWKGKVNHD